MFACARMAINIVKGYSARSDVCMT
jgi:hypothetical protein